MDVEMEDMEQQQQQEAAQQQQQQKEEKDQEQEPCAEKAIADAEENPDEDGEEEDEDEYYSEDDEHAMRMDTDAVSSEWHKQFKKLQIEAIADCKNMKRDQPKQPQQQHQSQSPDCLKQDGNLDIFGADLDEILGRKKRKKHNRRGPRTKERSNLNSELTKKLGEANLIYALGKKEQLDRAVQILEEVVRLAPDVSDSYHTLGRIYDMRGEKKKAMNFFMIAARLAPEKAPIWQCLATYFAKEGNGNQAIYCLTRAMKADPTDDRIQWERAMLCKELRYFQKAADAFDKMVATWPNHVEAHKMAAKMHCECGQREHAIQALQKFFTEHPEEGDLTVVSLLVSLLIENQSYSKAIEQIEHARMIYCSGQGLPLDLAVKAGMCHAYLGNFEEAERFFEDVHPEHGDDFSYLVDIANVYMDIKQYHSALKYFSMLEGTPLESVKIWLKIAQCYEALKNENAIYFYYKVLSETPEDINARLSLAFLLIEIENLDEAIQLLSEPENTENKSGCPWWLNGEVRKCLAQIYHSQGNYEAFVAVIYPVIKEALSYESVHQRVKTKKPLPKKELFKRVKLLDLKNDDTVFQGLGAILPSSDIYKASRARKRLQVLAARKEQKKSAALAAGLEWHSESEEEESSENETVAKESPLPNLQRDEKHYQLLIDACKALGVLRRFWEALDIINHALKLDLSPEKRKELRSLGAQYAYGTTDPKHGYDYARYLVQQHPYSLGAWNCYYKVTSRLVTRIGKHGKFLLAMRNNYPDCVPPMMICGHQFALISQHQGALCEYLEAYKRQPDDPLINLCVGTSFINLALGFRVNNKNLCVAQGFAFLYNYQRLCNNSQESNYNLARAFQHVGLVTLAVSYYEKVLSEYVEDQPIPKLPHEDLCIKENQPQVKTYGYCDLRREAAYNLHLIYKKSGALDLARQLLKDHCSS